MFPLDFFFFFSRLELVGDGGGGCCRSTKYMLPSMVLFQTGPEKQEKLPSVSEVYSGEQGR